MSETGALAQISRARQFLAQAKDLTDIKAVRDMAEAARQYARARDLGLHAMNEAAEIKLEAERKGGQVLAEMKKQKPGDYRKRSSETTVPIPPKIEDLGITRDQSSQWQAMAAVSEPDFKAIVDETKAAEKPLTTKAVVREGRTRKRDQAATAMQRGREQPRPEAEQSSPVNRQNLLDAQLRAAFSRAVKCVSEINALSPARVFEVLRAADIDRTEATLERLAVWLERFREARADMRPRTVGGTHA